MPTFWGDYNTTETVNIPFNTFTSDDPSASVTVTNLVAGDVEIYKDANTTARAGGDSGVTVSIDFDGIVGNHMVHIDLSDDTDAGFYADGSRYHVVLVGITVDSATLNPCIGGFSVGCTLTAADVKTAMEVDGGDLSSLMEALVNKRVWTEATGNLEMFNDAGVSQGTIAAQVATDGTFTTAKRALI